MAKIKITTDRRPWAAGHPQDVGAEVEVSEDEAKALVAAGFAEMLGSAGDDNAKPRRRRDNADV